MTTTKTKEELEALAASNKPDADPNEVLAKLLKTHSVVDVNGNTRVVSFDPDGKVRIQRKSDFDQFHCHLGTRRVARFWKKGTRYSGLVLDPSTDKLVVGGKLNTWRGWNVTPKPGGDWSLMRAHIMQVIADGDEDFGNYVLNWIAWMCQNPGKQAEVAVFVRGGKGDGKGVLGKVIVCWFGDVHSRHIINPDQITGRFNAQMQQCIFLFADEAILPKDRKAENVLKGLITEDRINVEKKGIDGYSVPNLLHIYGSTNDKWVAPMSHEERRFAVQTVSAKYRQKKEYFVPLFNQMFKAGGAEAMLHDMLHMKLGDWHPRYDIPDTAEAGRQKLASLQGIDRLIMDACDSGCLPEASEAAPNIAITSGEDDGHGLWAHCKKHVFGLKFETHMSMSYILREEWDCKHWHSGNQNGVKFPPLMELRAKFVSKFGEVAWSADDATDWRIG